MKKSAAVRSIRPRGRSPVISGRVSESLHERIQHAATKSGRSMSEELALLAIEALHYRDRYGSAAAAREIDWLTTLFVQAGEAAARERGIEPERWIDDLVCRRAAVVRLCELALMSFVSNPEEQMLCLEAIKSRVALPLFNPRLMK